MVKALALLCLVAGCVAPRVVVVVEPYVPIMHMEYSNGWVTGMARCDVNGQPVIQVHPRLDSTEHKWTTTHELIHVQQMYAFGGCLKFLARYSADSMFKLATESESYCGVLMAQRRLRVKPLIAFEEIVTMLMTRYQHYYTRDAVLAALPCG